MELTGIYRVREGIALTGIAQRDLPSIGYVKLGDAQHLFVNAKSRCDNYKCPLEGESVCYTLLSRGSRDLINQFDSYYKVGDTLEILSKQN